MHAACLSVPVHCVGVHVVILLPYRPMPCQDEHVVELMVHTTSEIQHYRCNHCESTCFTSDLPKKDLVSSTLNHFCALSLDPMRVVTYNFVRVQQTPMHIEVLHPMPVRLTNITEYIRIDISQSQSVLTMP
jgi:hypothetical protein